MFNKNEIKWASNTRYIRIHENSKIVHEKIKRESEKEDIKLTHHHTHIRNARHHSVMRQHIRFNVNGVRVTVHMYIKVAFVCVCVVVVHVNGSHCVCARAFVRPLLCRSISPIHSVSE